MKSFALGLILLASSSVAIANGSEVVGCFTSGKTNVKFVQIDREGVSLGYVKYQKSKTAIPLIYMGSSSEKNEGGGPDEFTTKWAEFIGAEINGYYTVTSQGARFYQFEYKSKKDKTTEFDDNINAYNESGTDCKW
ncbi:TPA: hypothetical protein N2R15_005222 [Citrobacter amalonaticus]|nr:hypothetical protein [Citrobacter amalonaticus]